LDEIINSTICTTVWNKHLSDTLPHWCCSKWNV